MGRYTGSPDTLAFNQRIDLRGFSAGSFAGLSMLTFVVEVSTRGNEWQARGYRLSPPVDRHSSNRSYPPSDAL